MKLEQICVLCQHRINTFILHLGGEINTSEILFFPKNRGLSIYCWLMDVISILFCHWKGT